MALVTPQQLENASADSNTISDVTSGDENTSVTSRLGRVFPTLAKTFADWARSATTAIDSIRAFNYRGEWTPTTSYAVKDVVIAGNAPAVAYVAPAALVSGASFEEDVAAGKWSVYQGETSISIAAATTASRIGTIQPGAGAVPQKIFDGLIPRPQDYGATADGVTDDSAAVASLKDQAAVDKRPVLVSREVVRSVPMVGIEHLVTAFSDPSEADFAQQWMSAAYAGAAIDIETFGDSTMWAADTANLAVQAPEPPPARLQALLRRYLGNNNITVTNSAISGTWIHAMLAGTDGSGLTFELRIADSAAQIVYCNHCINSCQLAHSLIEFKADWHRVVEITRKYGKTIIIVTPNPPLPVGLGDRRKVEQMKQYVEVMRQVARETGALLVDNYALLSKTMGSGRVTTITEIPDGIHPSNLNYTRMGQNMAIPLIGQGNHLSHTENFIPAFSANVLGTTTTANVVIANRTGGAIITTNGTGQSLRIPVVVDEAGLDIYIAVPLWPSGVNTANVYVDRTLVMGDMSFLGGWMNNNFMFIHDHEVMVLEDATPGLHFIEIEADGGLGLHHVRARPTRKTQVFTNNATFNYRQDLFRQLNHFNVGADSVILFDEFPTPRNFQKGYEVEFTCRFVKNSGIVFNGAYGLEPVNTAAKKAFAGYIVGVDESGFASVWENQSGVNQKLWVGTVDLTDASVFPDPLAVYVRFEVPSVTYRFGRLFYHINSALQATVVLTTPYIGGLLGTWNQNAVTALFTIDAMCYLNRGN